MTAQVTLRDVQEGDLEILFEQQLDPEASRMAAFPSRRSRGLHGPLAKAPGGAAGVVVKAIIFRGEVAGNVVAWELAGERKVGYWLGRNYWGLGIASAALAQLVTLVTGRPLYAHVAKHNIASIRVLEKCGFRLVREGAIDDGTPGDEFVYELAEAGAEESRASTPDP